MAVKRFRQGYQGASFSYDVDKSPRLVVPPRTVQVFKCPEGLTIIYRVCYSCLSFSNGNEPGDSFDVVGYSGRNTITRCIFFVVVAPKFVGLLFRIRFALGLNSGDRSNVSFVGLVLRSVARLWTTTQTFV